MILIQKLRGSRRDVEKVSVEKETNSRDEAPGDAEALAPGPRPATPSNARDDSKNKWPHRRISRLVTQPPRLISFV